MKSLFRATVDLTRGVMEPLMARRGAVAEAPPPPPLRPPVANRSYAAVTVRPCAGACEAAQALAHKRILRDEAPTDLPLPGCTNNACQCRFEEFEDRRAADERRHRPEDTSSFDGDVNRRLPGERRVNKQRAKPTSYFNDY